MKKTYIWLIVWGILLAIGLGVAITNEVIYILENGVVPNYPPYETYQVLSLFVLLPVFLIPSISITLYFSIKEKIKAVKIIAIIILVHHILAFIGAIVDGWF